MVTVPRLHYDKTTDRGRLPILILKVPVKVRVTRTVEQVLPYRFILTR